MIEKNLPKEQALQIRLATHRSGHKFWKQLEREIQERSSNKDPKFGIIGMKKQFIRVQDGIKVYLVDGEWLRNNVSIIFGHGGHGLVHEFIPIDEVWISTRHYKNKLSKCSCRNRVRGGKITEQFFEETVTHEIKELQEMLKGKPYWKAHIKATLAEVEL